MFELLLQADRALAEGQLDRAEKTYWQLIELDPTNAIALAGLSRINLDRGDQRLARTLAERALGMDPDSFVARRVLSSIDNQGELPAPIEVDLTFLGAERLEALSRRRRQGDDASEAGAGHPTSGPTGPSIRKTAPARPGARTPAARTASASRSSDTHLTADERERQKKGRIAAAAAAAGMAVREPAAPKAEKPPKAEPVDAFLAAETAMPEVATPEAAAPKAEKPRKPEPVDPFAAAEMAAAIEAVDEVDIELPELDGPPSDSRFDAIEAESTDASVALRLATLGEESELEPADEHAAEPPVDALPEPEPEPLSELEPVADETAEPPADEVPEPIAEPPAELVAEPRSEADSSVDQAPEPPAEPLVERLEAEPAYADGWLEPQPAQESQPVQESQPAQAEPGEPWLTDEPQESDGKKKKGFLGRFRG